MGHTLTEWVVKVRASVQVASRRQIPGERIEAVGLRPAFMRFSVDRPLRMVTEAAGTDGSYFNLPAGWVSGFSQLEQIEMPARQNPPMFLPDNQWQLVRSTSDVSVEQIQTTRPLDTASFARFTFTVPWPYPTATADGDAVDALGFEAVAALAASLIIGGLALDDRRRRAEHALEPDTKPEGTPDVSLEQIARSYEAIYLRYLGIDPTTPGTSTTTPVSTRLDFSRSDSVFHNGPIIR